MKVLDCLGHQYCQAGGTINFVYAWWKLTTVRDKYRVIHQISGEYINMQNDNYIQIQTIHFQNLTLTLHPYLRILAPGYPHEAQVFFWIWKLTRPHLLQMVWVLFRRLPNELVPLVWNVNFFISLNTRNVGKLILLYINWSWLYF